MVKKTEGAEGDKYIRPRRAEKKFRLAQEMGQNIYLCGMMESGKTAFVESMLGGKGYVYFSAKEAAAEEIVVRDDKRHVIVIDDMHEVTGESQREEYAASLRLLLRRRSVRLVLLSRCSLPQWLMPVYLDREFLVITEEDLRLERQQQDEYFEKWDVSLPPKEANRVWQMGGGHPLFLRFVALSGGNVDQAADDMWKYFLYIYDRWDTELQEFMMEMSVVERFDLPMAQMVTGRRNVEQLLRRIVEMGNFLIEKDGMYEYNFFLKGFIQIFLERKFDPEELCRIYYNAGHMYELYGDIPNALKMHEAGGDEKSILRLLVANARQNPACGHYFELRRYYLLLPEEAICSSPVMMAGMSMLQSMIMNKEESERWYHLLEEYAAGHDGSAKREAKNRLLYLDIALPHRGTVKILELLKHAGTLLKEGKAMLPEFSVTSNLPSLMNGGKDFCEWSKRDKELASSAGKVVEFVLGKYGKGLVSVALAESYLEKGMDSYEIAALAEKGRMQADAGGKTELIFVAVGLLVWLSVLSGHGEDACDMMESFRRKAEKEAPRLLPNVDAFLCRMALYQGKVAQALEWLEEAPDENEDFCSLERFRYLTKVRVYLQFGKYDKAYGILQKLLYYAEQQERGYIAAEAGIFLSLLKYRRREADWQVPLQECITWAEGYHFVRIFSREGEAVGRLLKEGDFTWQDEEYRRQVLKECEKMGRQYPSYLKEKADGDVRLSKNALSILRLQAEGYQTEQIAKKLGITGNTVKYHSRETYRKLHVSGKAAAVNEAKNRGLI